MTVTELTLTRKTRSLCMLRRQGIGLWNKQVHDFTTSTLRTKQIWSLEQRRRRAFYELFCSRERWTEAPVGIQMDRRDVGGLPNNKRLLFLPGIWQETYCLCCQDHLHHIYQYILSTERPPTTFPAFCKQDGGDVETVSLAGSIFFFLFFSPQALRGEKVLRRRWWTEISKWCLLFVLFSTHACPFHSSPPSQLPLCLNHTSNNDFEEKGKSQRQHFGAPPSPFLSGCFKQIVIILFV